MNENQRRAARHNWIRRRVAGARTTMLAVMKGDTVSDKAYRAAKKIDDELGELLVLLEKREDQV